MTDMVEIVIKLPKQTYDYLINLYKERGMTDFNGYAENAIANGIVLPKRHGRLIDADQLMNYCQNQIDGHKYADCNVIARFPVVLNAEVENE